jgi:hypothetical protein
MAKAFKLFDGNTGLVVYRDCITGAELTAEQVAAVTPCPDREMVSSEVCIQPIGNADPTLIETGAKQVCTFEISYNADDTIDASTLIGTVLISAAGVDACPVALTPVGEVCYAG